jgi:Mg-chelatase subunit ChlD
MRFVKSSAAVFLACIMLTSLLGAFGVSGVMAAGETDKISYNRYNIVLVTDTSGSMNNTDKEGLRFEAIGKFIALLAESGNRMGTVVFNGDVAFTQAITDADGMKVKREFLENVKGIPAAGHTNIGKGLKTAVEMLDRDKNPELPSIILLLSDGNTDLATKEEKTLSLEQKADAIQSARDSGYKIYSVSLNADGSANSEELAQIAKATGGQFQEVKNADSLEDVFSMYYEIIFGSVSKNGEEKTFPPSGEINGIFEIPTVGVEEVNIVMSGNVSDYSLVDPTDMPYSKNDLSGVTYSSDTFNVIKIVDPLSGEWKYLIKGIPGDQIQINIVYNTNLAAGINISPQNDVYMANDIITVSAFLTESGQNVRSEQYSAFTAKLSVTDGQGDAQSYDMTLAADGFEYALSPPKGGTYTVRANIAGQDYNLFTDSVKLNVDNTPPTANNDIEETVLLWPFSDNKKSIDLTPGATDAQDATLRYEVESSAFNDNEFSLNGGTLTMNGYSLSKGSFTIRAYDSDGAYCTFNVLIKTVNMTLLGIILLAGGIVIAAAVIGGGLWIALNKRFYGACYVTQFDNNGVFYEEVKREKGRGRLYLTAFNLGKTGFNTKKCYFQATGKDYVFFVTSDIAYGDGTTDNKFRIDGNGYEVTISTDAFAQSGIRVKFISRRNNTDYSF